MANVLSSRLISLAFLKKHRQYARCDRARFTHSSSLICTKSAALEIYKFSELRSFQLEENETSTQTGDSIGKQNDDKFRAMIARERVHAIACEANARELDERMLERKKKKNETVVCIFAWFGSEKRHVRKYAEMYRGLGNDVIVCAPPALASLSASMTHRIANEFLSVVHDEYGECENVCVHSFSNGGFMFCGNLLHHGGDRVDLGGVEDEVKVNRVLAREFKEKIKTVTLDCSPATLTSDVVSRALASVLLGARVEDVIGDGKGRIGSFMKSALDVLANTLMSDEKLKKKIENAYKAWESEIDSRVPLKLLYSESDSLVPKEEIEAFAKRSRERGHPIYMKSWSNVPHCEIGRYHYDEYVDALFRKH
jgi:hypothetical protein